MVHLVFGFSCIFRISELHKSKAAWFPRVVVSREINIPNRPKAFKWNTKVFWPRVERDVADKEAGGGGAAVPEAPPSASTAGATTGVAVTGVVVAFPARRAPARATGTVAPAPAPVSTAH